MIEPRNVKGVMELMPEGQIKFNSIMDTIKEVYEMHGFIPMDTPVFELSEILLAKAGGDTEKEIYTLKKGSTDMALRFDLTVPLAKYVAKNYNNLTFPFRRYQIGKSYRGERPQKGRFRELYQGDIDIIGDGSLAIEYDAEIPSIIYDVFKRLKVPKFTIRISNKKILSGIIDSLDLKDKKQEIGRVIDKYDKIGEEEVIKELKALELTDDKIEKLISIITCSGTSQDKISMLESLNITNAEYLEGISEIKTVLSNMKVFGVPEDYYMLDLVIVRGLDYYTGTVYETMIDGNYDLGSVCSGGRYENLAGNYTDKKLPGVGISIGITRLYDQLFSEINEDDLKTTTKVMIIPEYINNEDSASDNLEANEINQKIQELTSNTIKRLKEKKVSFEIYMQDKKFKAKLKYANKLNIPYVVIIGAVEANDNTITFKDMNKGEQKEIKPEDIENVLD